MGNNRPEGPTVEHLTLLLTEKEKMISSLELTNTTLTRNLEHCQQLLRVRTEKYTLLKRHTTRLEELSLVDDKTRLLNEKGLNERGKAVLSQYAESGRRSEDHYGDEYHVVSIVYIDINYFKQVNDKIGTRYGDDVLRILGMILKKRLRSASDIAARPHGDEFVLVLPGITIEETEKVIKSIKAEFDNFPFDFNKGKQPDEVIPVNFTYGIASTSEGYTDLETLKDTAERKMYAKREADGERVVR